jgi:hypothetical protein
MPHNPHERTSFKTDHLSSKPSAIMNRQASNAFLRDQINVSSAEVRDKLIDEGVTFDSIADFDEDDIQSLCASVRRPGGQVQDANGDRVCNDGIAVPYLVEKRLKLACYAARYYTKVGRPIDASLMTWDFISKFDTFKQLQDEHKDPKDLPPVSKSLPILKWMEVFESYLQNTLGVAKVPLAYVTREDAGVDPIARNPLGPPHQDQQPVGQKYSTFYEEMIARTSHAQASYAADNQTVLELLVKSFKEHPGLMSSIRPHQWSGNGRAALEAVILHNMGNTKWDDLINKAVNKITKAVWNGKNSRYPLIRHISDHRTSYNDIVKAADHIDYAVMNERTRVTHLLDSIQCNHQQLVAAKTAILSDDAKRNNFELAADFLLLNAKFFKSEKTQNDWNVSVLKQKDGNRPQVELRYYKKKEYEKLTKDQRAELHRLRKKKVEDDSNNAGSEHKTTISALQSKIDKLENLLSHTISAMESRKDDSEDEKENKGEKKRVRFNNTLTQRP